MPKRAISPASSLQTRPTSSTSPVNTILLAGWIEGHGDVLADRLYARHRELDRLGHLRHAQGPDHRHAPGADELRRVEQGELVGQAPLDEAGGGLPAALDEQAPDPVPSQLLQDEAEIQALRRRGRADDLDAESLELVLAGIERSCTGEDHHRTLRAALDEPIVVSERKLRVQDHARDRGWLLGQVAGGEQWVVGPDGARPDQDGPRLSAQPVGAQPRVLAGHPLAVAARSCDSAVQGGGELEVHEWAPGQHEAEKLLVLQLESGVVEDLDLETCPPQYLGALAPHPRVGVEVPHDDPGDARAQYGFGAGRRAPVVVARFHGDVHGSPARLLTSMLQRGHLGVVSTGPG